MRFDLPILVGLALALFLTGCSSAIALTQYAEKIEHPKVTLGDSRMEVESKLGQPVSTEAYADGSCFATYTYRTYRPQFGFWSSPGGRAIQMGLGGAGTLYFSELVFVPMEIGGKIYREVTKEKHWFLVTYGGDDRVVWADRRLARPGEDKPSE